MLNVRMYHMYIRIHTCIFIFILSMCIQLVGLHVHVLGIYKICYHNTILKVIYIVFKGGHSVYSHVP